MIHFLVDDSAARVPEVSSDHRLVLHFPHAKGQCLRCCAASLSVGGFGACVAIEKSVEPIELPIEAFHQMLGLASAGEIVIFTREED